MKILSLSAIKQQFPRSANYDLAWVAENQMGPNVLWLVEALTKDMKLKPGMRVLDMGCGKALSSIFLAKEFGVQVWATDLWIPANENWQRIRAAGLEEQVFPIHAEAHNLPYAEEFFDAIVSMDAYHYFGTNDIFYGWYFNKLLKPGGQMGINVPGIKDEIKGDEPPDHLRPYWSWEFFSFHSPEWWKRNWQRSGMLTVERAEWLHEGWKLWLAWHEYMQEQSGRQEDEQEAEMLRVDAGRTLGFSKIVARKKDLAR